MKVTLERIDIPKNNTIVCLGAIVKTSVANYFLAASVGQLKVNDELFFAISASTPIGKLLLGKKEGDSISFNGKEIKIESIL